MAIQAQNMTQGPLGRQILRFSVPLMLSNVLQVLFNMSDIAVVGRYAGSIALGAVGSTTTLVTLFTGFLMGIGNGVNVLTARFFGAQSEKHLRQTVHTSVLLCILMGILLLVIGSLFSRSMLELLHTKSELIDGAVLYLKIYFLGMPAVAIYNFGSGVLSAVGDTRRPLYILFGAGVLNVALNLFFVIVCQMDVAGVALASIISQYLSASCILVLLFTSRTGYGLQPKALRLTPDKARLLLKLGVPCGIQYSIFALASLFIQVGVNSFDAVMVAGNSAAANSDALVYDVMAAFCTACSSFIGQNYGAQNPDRIRRSYLVSLGYCFGVGALLGIALVVFGREFLSLFTTDAEVVAAGMTRLKVMAYSYAFSAFMDCTIAASRGLGRSVVPTIVVLVGCCVLRVCWVYTVFAHFSTILSLYLVYICSWVITAIAEILYFIHAYRQTKAQCLAACSNPA